MAFPPNVWNQIKNLTADEIKKALERDNFQNEGKRGAVLGFYRPGNPPKRVTIHYHPKKTYGAKLLQGLIADIGWTEDDSRIDRLVAAGRCERDRRCGFQAPSMSALTLDGARVLIPGGAGLIGSHIADHLVQEQVAEIVALDNFVRGRREDLAAASERGRVTPGCAAHHASAPKIPRSRSTVGINRLF